MPALCFPSLQSLPCRRWRLLARSLAATRAETVRRFLLPGILWIVLLPCEMLGVSSGLGYAILDAPDRFACGNLMALVLVVGALGFPLDRAAQGPDRLFRALSS